MADTKVDGCEGYRPTFEGQYGTAQAKATQCRDQLERETGKPYGIDFHPGNHKEGVPEYHVHLLLDCQEGREYSFVTPLIPFAIDNEDESRQCSEALTRITGKTHEAVRVPRFLIADAWVVQLKK